MFLHKIGTPEKDDVLIYKEDDDAFFLDVTKSKDDEWIVISSNAKDTSEVRILKTSHLTSKPLLVQPRTNGVKFFLDHIEGKFYCVTNRDNAYNFKLIVANSSSLLPNLNENTVGNCDSVWSMVVPDREDASILDVDIFRV